MMNREGHARFRTWRNFTFLSANDKYHEQLQAGWPICRPASCFGTVPTDYKTLLNVCSSTVEEGGREGGREGLNQLRYTY